MASAIVDALNELLEAERAGVETLAMMKRQHPELAPDLGRIERDEAWSCAGLQRCIAALGGKASEGKGDFAAKVAGLPNLPDRLQLLARGQQWVVKRIDAVLEKAPIPDVTSFLQQMKVAHQHNIDWCYLHLEGAKKAG